MARFWWQDLRPTWTGVDRVADAVASVAPRFTPPRPTVGFLSVDQVAMIKRMGALALQESRHRHMGYPPGLADAIFRAARRLMDATPWFNPAYQPLTSPDAFGYWQDLAIDSLRMFADHLPHDTGASGAAVTVEAIGECRRARRLVLEIVQRIHNDRHISEPAGIYWGEVEENASNFGATGSKILSQLKRMLKDDTDSVLERVLDDMSIGDVRSLLDGTPFAAALRVHVPLTIPLVQSRSIIWICGGMGWGKTLIVIDELRRRLRLGHGCLVFDTQDLTQKILESCDLPADRIVLVDPTDDRFRPKINPCKIGGSAKPAQFLNLFNRIMDAIGADITAPQKIVLEYLGQIVQAMPVPTLGELIEILSGDSTGKISRYESRLPDAVAKWVSAEWDTPAMIQSREAVRRKVSALNGSPELAGMFGAIDTNFDIGALLNAGKLVIIRLDKDVLADKVTMVGTIFLALATAAMWGKNTRDPNLADWVWFLDELKDYVGDNGCDHLATFLSQCRKYRVSPVIAHQQFRGQLPEELVIALHNSQVRIFGGIGNSKHATDAAALLKCSKQQLTSLKLKTNGDAGTPYPDKSLDTPIAGRFICKIQGRVDDGVELEVQFPVNGVPDALSDQELDDRMTELAKHWSAQVKRADVTASPAGDSVVRVVQWPERRNLGGRRQ